MWIDQKYIMLISSGLMKFTEKDNGYNFRCPFCGDSQKNENTARGYLIQYAEGYRYYCHNCTDSRTFRSFIKEVNPTLFDDYVKETYLEKSNKRPTKAVKNQIHKEQDDLGIPSVMWLDLDHPARAELDRRKVPARWHSRLYYAENYNAFANKFVKGKYDPEKGEARIVIPLRTRDGKLAGFQGRALDKHAELRYLTTLLSPDNDKLFNLDRVNFNITNYALEGAVDAMMLSNAFAVCGSDLNSAVRKAELNTSQTAFVFDNEPRNKDIVRQMNKTIRNGIKIVIWPSEVPVGYDVNDVVCKTDLDVEQVLKDNIYGGLQAELAIVKWKQGIG